MPTLASMSLIEDVYRPHDYRADRCQLQRTYFNVSFFVTRLINSPSCGLVSHGASTIA